MASSAIKPKAQGKMQSLFAMELPATCHLTVQVTIQSMCYARLNCLQS